MLLQVALILGVVAALGFVLRWTFRDTGAPAWPDATGSDTSPGPDYPTAGYPAASLSTPSYPALALPASPDRDYGLLQVVSSVATAEQASRARSALTDAGIRATTTQAPDGTWRLLVFGKDLDRARGVLGSRSVGGDSGTGAEPQDA